ncbi:MAG: T9SS type A sorting domain-containing protein [Bacteroidota bacterium]
MNKALLTTVLLLVSLLALGFTQEAKACDRSEISLDSVVAGPGYYDIYIEMRVGGGITGTQKGGGGDTRTFAFAFYSSGSINEVTFTPSVVGDSVGSLYPGINVGSAFGANFVIGYIDTGLPFTCVSSTAICGNRHTQVEQMFFRLDALPDSLRLFGIEGAGNPFAGCYPDADMLLDFTTLPVEWAGFDAQVEESGVALDWSTISETNNDQFLVQRSADGINYETIGQVESAGNGNAFNSYRYLDQNPLNGANFYQIVQVDLDGKSSASEVLSVEFTVASGLFWTAVGPNPVQSNLNMSFNSGKSQSLLMQIVDLQGRVIRQQNIDALAGVNSAQVDLTGEAAGFYYLRISGTQEKIDKKILKM